VGFSDFSISSSAVTSYSETDLTYYAELYYYVETDAFLSANGSIVRREVKRIGLETSTLNATTRLSGIQPPPAFKGGPGWAAGPEIIPEALPHLLVERVGADRSA
jgi:hypothetical protein